MPENWTLVMETSVPEATLVLARGDTLVAQGKFTSERSQEVDLFGPLQDILSGIPEGGNLSYIIVGTGPGSYNGARVGIATAQAIAQVHNCPVAGLCSFEGVPGLKWAVGDARRGSFFILEVGSDHCPELLAPEEFLVRLSKCEGRKGTFESAEKLGSLAGEIEEVTPTAEGLFQAWRARSEEEKKKISAIPAEAFYLRAPHITVSKKRH
ncbi:MAG: tRNA (adenosine(37)-N6)-threonylcarbamoyltransferase complex dimerization subunit type 1 TsaB [Akkermansiaceae bacterium]